MRFINMIFWLQAFIAPVLLGGFIGLAVGSVRLTIILLIVGAIAGIIIAEYIRRKIGLSTFFGSLYGSSEKLKKKKD